MTFRRNAERECRCLTCEPAGPGDPRAEDEYFRGVVAHVEEYGWSVCGVTEEDGLPGWAYTIGLWHNFGSPEVAMFGLLLPDMHAWLNTLGKQIEEGAPVLPGEHRSEVIDGFDVVIRPVHESWYSDLFGAGLGFYGRLVPPFMQVVWPDRYGVLPWEEDCGPRCRHDQPSAWLPAHEHPTGVWRDIDVLTPWPFPGVPADTMVFTTRRILDGDEQIRLVVHDHDGSWQFLDGREVDPDVAAMVHLEHIVSDQPWLAILADLEAGELAEQDSAGLWHRAPISRRVTEA